MDIFEKFVKENVELEKDTHMIFQPTLPLFQRWERHCLIEGDKLSIGSLRTFVATLKSKYPKLKFGRVGPNKVSGVLGLRLLPDSAEPPFEGLATQFDSREMHQ
jgi:hypothetical protein